MQHKTAHIFPAFTLKYTGKEIDIINKNGGGLQNKLQKVLQLTDINLTDFNIEKNNFLDNELKNQIMSYVFACSFSEMLKKNRQTPDYISGFSMGIYAALYHAGSIDFETGLNLIVEIYNETASIYSRQKVAMASVIGFVEDDLKAFARNYDSIEIVIKNGRYSFIVTGEKLELEHFIYDVTNEGAMHTAIFNVQNSYHSQKLNQKFENFRLIVEKFKITDASTPLISMVSQELLLNADSLSKEIILNIVSKLNFHQTVKTMNNLGVNYFIEAGADISLLKSSKFIEGDFKFESTAKGKLFSA